MKNFIVRASVVIAVLGVGPTEASTSPPVGVSPGVATGASVAAPCPTFSWGRVEGALAYDLVVYRVDEQGIHEEVPSLVSAVPGGALAWTPSLEHCFPAGATYAWSVRAVLENDASEWANPLLFEVREVVSEDDVLRALEVIRRHFGARTDDGVSRSASESSTETSGAMTAAVASISAGIAEARITVDGEVRTVDSSDPGGRARVWGEGRTGEEVYGRNILFGGPCTKDAVKYGLSKMSANWGSAAAACPVGTWVCRRDEIDSCETTRPTDDRMECDGTLTALSGNIGWVADPRSDANGFYGTVMGESGLTHGARVCTTYPAWCCWE